jgi:GntR family transcriptional regulator
MSLINKNSAIPYYQQLADLLRGEIAANPPGSSGMHKLPSENELAGLHGVTRATVRHAMDMLEQEGKIYRVKGKGAFAAVQRLEPAAPRLLSTTELMEQRRLSLDTWFISLIQVPAMETIASTLELDLGDSVYELKRLQVAEDIPFGIQTAYLPVHLCPRLEDNDLTESLYRLLEIRYGLRLWSGQETLRARAATPSEARLLQVNPGTPVMDSARVSYAVTGAPVEYLKAAWRGDRYEFTVTLARPIF